MARKNPLPKCMRCVAGGEGWVFMALLYYPTDRYLLGCILIVPNIASLMLNMPVYPITYQP